MARNPAAARAPRLSKAEGSDSADPSLVVTVTGNAEDPMISHHSVVKVWLKMQPEMHVERMRRTFAKNEGEPVF